MSNPCKFCGVDQEVCLAYSNRMDVCCSRKTCSHLQPSYNPGTTLTPAAFVPVSMIQPQPQSTTQ